MNYILKINFNDKRILKAKNYKCKKNIKRGIKVIKIVAKNKIKNGMVNNFKKTAEELIIKSNKEKGCISYDLYVDINDSSVLTFLESWDDEEAIFNHNNSDHFKEIVPKLGEFVEEKEVRKYILLK